MDTNLIPSVGPRRSLPLLLASVALLTSVSTLGLVLFVHHKDIFYAESDTKTDLSYYYWSDMQVTVSELATNMSLLRSNFSSVEANVSQLQSEFEALTGGWVLVMKLTGAKTLGYSSAYWTNDQTLNPTSSLHTAGDAKYEAFSQVAVKSIKMCIGHPKQNCLTTKLPKTYTSCKALFSAGYVAATIDKSTWMTAFGVTSGSYQDCDPDKPGFNLVCPDSNWARWGYCNNCASQSCDSTTSPGDADAVIGVGLHGQSTPREMGGGWTNYFASGSGTCNANSMQSKNIWLWVQP